MQSIQTVLEIYHARGKEGKSLERLYEQLFKPELYGQAYSQIYANRGALTKGNSEETMDGMSVKRWNNIIQKLRDRTYHWTAPRYQDIPKAKGGTRRLGIPTGNDKLLQAAMKILLEVYYEPQFSDRSHGFRPRRGCHTALVEVRQKLKGASWFIEGDIKGCFDNIDHEILLKIVGEKIKDKRFLNLVRKLLASGHMENWGDGYTLSGTPQGGVVSPLLANIYMDVFDKWVERELMPRYNYGRKRRKNPVYQRLTKRIANERKKGNWKEVKRIRNERRGMPSGMTHDDLYRRLNYVRYADDFLLGFAGPKDEAEKIKEEIKKFLKDKLNLEMSEEKTLITNASIDRARFLGYDIGSTLTDERVKANKKIWLGVPKEVVLSATKPYMKNGKSNHRAEMINDSDYHIVQSYQIRFRGLVQYYIMAHNISKRLGTVKGVMEDSMLKTLANKHRTKTTPIAKKLRARKVVGGTSYKTFEVKVPRKSKKPLTTHWGAIPLSQEQVPKHITDKKQWTFFNDRSETLWRLLAENCEACGEKNVPLEAHHIKALKDIKPGKTAWERRMIALNRIVMMVCRPCHVAKTNGTHLSIWDEHEKAWKESRVR